LSCHLSRALALNCQKNLNSIFGDEITSLLYTTRDLSSKTANFWALVLGIDKRTVWGKIKGVKFSLFYYEYPLIKKMVSFEDIQVLAKEDTAAMKINCNFNICVSL